MLYGHIAARDQELVPDHAPLAVNTISTAIGPPLLAHPSMR
jgi:hypothetical protein